MKWIDLIKWREPAGMQKVCTGHTNSKVEFELFASAPLSATDLRNIGNLMHAGATKVEEEFSEDARITG